VSLSPARARLLVAALLILALGLRVWRVQSTSYTPVNDAGSYMTLASQIAHSGDYTARSGAGGTRGPTAYFPPAFSYFLAAVDLIDGHRTPAGPSVHPARLATAVLGTATVALVGLVALEALGATIALLALALSAVYPAFIEMSATLYAENLMVPLVLAAVWAALRARRSEHPYRWIAAAGVLTGLGTLTHTNAVVLVVPLALAAWAARREWRAPVLLVVAAALAVVPWTVRNAVVMHAFIPVSDENGITLAGTYNPTSAADHRIPYRWLYYGQIPSDSAIIRETPRLTEPQLDSKLEHAAFHYISHHPLAPLKAAYHNLRRLLELEGSAAWEASAASVSLSSRAARIGVFGFWIVALLAVAGAFTRRARRGPWWMWLAPALLALSVILVNSETPRFRMPIDPFLIMLAACALVTAAVRVRRRLAASDAGAPVRGDELRAPPAGSLSELIEVVQGGS
jgi:4-amino-4-deoxy-L-arabinose transferase-like glycosyltransferase